MTKFILILLIALVFEAIGVVFLSGGLKQIGEPKIINAAEIGNLTVFLGAIILDMEKSIILVFTLSVGAMLASCAGEPDTDTTTTTTHQTNRQTYQLPLGRTYDPN